MCCIGALLLRYYGYFCWIDTTRTYRYIETEKNGLLNSTNSLWRYLHEIVQQCTWHVFLFQPALFNNKKYLRRGCKLLTQVKIINNIFSISCKLPKETMSAFTRRNNFFLTKVCVWSLWISKKKKIATSTTPRRQSNDDGVVFFLYNDQTQLNQALHFYSLDQLSHFTLLVGSEFNIVIIIRLAKLQSMWWFLLQCRNAQHDLSSRVFRLGILLSPQSHWSSIVSSIAYICFLVFSSF